MCLSSRAFFIFFLLCVITNIAQAAFYDRHAQGWHWYNEVKEEDKKKPSASTPPPPASDPLVELEQLQERVKRTRAKAVLTPTIDNVRAYMALQHQVTGKAHQFSQMWQRVLLLKPSLNYSLTRPTTQLARHQYLDNESKQKDNAIYEFTRRYGLFFFYRSTCPYCHRFAPILKRFVSRYDIPLVAVTLDGGVLPDFPGSKRDSGQGKQFGVKVVPALFAIDPKTGRAFAVAYGMMSVEALRDRFYSLIKWQKDNEKNKK